jgi:hypothetical protein
VNEINPGDCGIEKLRQAVANSKPPARVPVTERALIQRINRRLAKEDCQLRVSRGARAELELGRYYIIDPYRNVIENTHLGIEELGRELGCFGDFETLVEDQA